MLRNPPRRNSRIWRPVTAGIGKLLKKPPQIESELSAIKNVKYQLHGGARYRPAVVGDTALLLRQTCKTRDIFPQLQVFV